MDWAALEREQFLGASSAARIAARKLLDMERIRLYNLDKINGSNLLLAWTLECRKGLEMSEIRTDVAPPAETPKPAKRGRPRGAGNKTSQASQLQMALDFVECTANSNSAASAPYSNFVSLVGNMATVFNGQMSAGHPIVEELTLIPHLATLKAALARCGKTLVITETENQRLSIKGDKLRALIECNIQPIPPNKPDPPTLQGDFNALKEAMKVCSTLASENGERVVQASILLEPNTCTGTNGAAMLQFWHGINCPPGTVVSKLFASAVAKQTKAVTGLGATWNADAGFATSLTVWFEGGAWIKTQCYNDRWPGNINDILLGTNPEKVEVPKDLFEAIAAVMPFIEGKEQKRVHFMQDYVQSHNDANVGAQYPVKDLPGGMSFDAKLISQVAPWVSKIAFDIETKRAFFNNGGNVRGVIMAMGS